jgi:hypothetical protein
VRRLAQPQVVTAALAAAAASALLCLPRILLWDKRKFTVPYIELTLFCGGFVLWAFVFAWHTEYTRRPLFTLKIKPALFAIATLFGIGGALVSHFFLDPTLRQISPEEYPPDLMHWVASTLFLLAFTQLFLLFAPYAWAVRLFRSEQIAIGFIVVFCAALWWHKMKSSPMQLAGPALVELLVLRVVQSLITVWFYLRGGIFLAWWLALLIETRHLLTFCGF